jgi:hypothetical protein
VHALRAASVYAWLRGITSDSGTSAQSPTGAAEQASYFFFLFLFFFRFQVSVAGEPSTLPA